MTTGREAEMAVALNRALRPYLDHNGQVSVQEIMIACGVVLEAYIRAIPKHEHEAYVEQFCALLRQQVLGERRQ